MRERQGEWAFDPVPQVLGSYGEVIASPDVDAVYLPLPTGLRKEWVLKAARAGKHVLCEKPCGVSADDLQEMIAVCAENKVQFMDGVMFMHNPRQAAVRGVLDDEKVIGRIRRVTSTFSFLGHEGFDANIRVRKELEPAGCLGDLGWYCLRYSLFALNWVLPRSATGRIHTLAADGETPMEFSGELFFDGGATAAFYCSFLTESQQWVDICGERGSLRLDDFIHPHNSYEPHYSVNGVDHWVAAGPGTVIPGTPGELRAAGHGTAQDARMFRAFAEQAQAGGLNQEWPEVALKTQLVLDACLASARKGGGEHALAEFPG